jgi:predicted TIM-barrel fold metal-dependent hydrolase
MNNRRSIVCAVASLLGLPSAWLPLKAASKELAQMSEPGFTVPPLATDCHVHIFDPEHFPYAAHRRYTPPPATVDDLLRMHDILGLQRAVLVQPSVYGTDNACLLTALRRLGSRARGVAVIDSSFTRAQLEDLLAHGVRGVRINLEVAKDVDPAKAANRLSDAAERLAGLPLLIQVYAALPVIAACAPVIKSLRQRILIDHFGLAKGAAGVQQPGFDELLSLVRLPHVFMKLSGPYQVSTQSPGYADIAPIATALATAAADRVVWGSDWPHTGGTHRPADYKHTDLEPFRPEDDGRNLGLIKDWLPAEAARQKLLVANPAALFGFS